MCKWMCLSFSIKHQMLLRSLTQRCGHFCEHRPLEVCHAFVSHDMPFLKPCYWWLNFLSIFSRGFLNDRCSSILHGILVNDRALVLFCPDLWGDALAVPGVIKTLIFKGYNLLLATLLKCLCTILNIKSVRVLSDTVPHWWELHLLA